MKTFLSFFVGSAVALSCCVTSQAATVFTNLSGAIASNLPVGITGADWTYGAQQFNSGANTSVTDVTLYLARAAGTVTGTYSIEVWEEAFGVPIGPIGSIATGLSPSGVTLLGPQTVTFSGTVPVTANTNYWIVMNMSNNASQLQWQYTNDSPTSLGFIGVAGTALLQSGDTGDDFITPDGITSGRLMMSVTAVPEPSTSCMALAGLACGGYLVRRRRKRA